MDRDKYTTNDLVMNIPGSPSNTLLSVLLIGEPLDLAKALARCADEETFQTISTKLKDLLQHLQSERVTFMTTNTAGTGTTNESNGVSVPVPVPVQLPVSPSLPNAQAQLAAPNNEPQYHSWLHPDGLFRRVPPGWEFPSGKLEDAYVHWQCGDHTIKQVPIQYLNYEDIPDTRRHKRHFCDFRLLMNIVDTFVNQQTTPSWFVEQHHHHNMTMAQARTIYQKIQAAYDLDQGPFRLPPTHNGHKKRRLQDTTWATIARFLAEEKELCLVERQDKAGMNNRHGSSSSFLIQHIIPSPRVVHRHWIHSSDGVVRRVPEGWGGFPRCCSMLEIFVMWHCGQDESDMDIGPYKLLSSVDCEPIKALGQTTRRDLAFFMSLFDQEAVRRGLLQPNAYAFLSKAEAQTIFEVCAPGALEAIFPDDTLDSLNTKSWYTLKERARKKNYKVPKNQRHTLPDPRRAPAVTRPALVTTSTRPASASITRQDPSAFESPWPTPAPQGAAKKRAKRSFHPF